MTAVGEFIDFFSGFQSKTEDPDLSEIDSGIVDIVCGCMISKWTSVEFTKIFGLEKDYLQIAIIYMEPFCGYDDCILYMDFDRIPSCIMDLYEFARTHTIIEEVDDSVRMLITRVSNPRRYAPHKIMLKTHYYALIGSTVELEGLYLNSEHIIKKMENIFNRI